MLSMDDMLNKLPKSETWFTFKVLAATGPDEPLRMLTPHGDPLEYEYPADQMFETVEKAEAYKDEHYPDETFLIVEETFRSVKWVDGKPTEDW